MMVLPAFALWYTLYPSLETAQTWELTLVLQTWIVNMGLVFLLAGGLHWVFYIKKGQGARLRFSHRPLMRQNCKFNFSDQVKNNMFWALGSGTAQLTGFDGLWFRHKKRMHLVNFHHQIHHHYFEVNHGTLDVP
jgi:lathosterol oxidase